MFNFDTKTGTPIHLDGSKEPSFFIDAGDIKFIEKIHSLYTKMNEYVEKSRIEISKFEIDDKGVPVDSVKFVDNLKADYDFILKQIDELLGDGVSEKVFQGRYNQNLLSKFIDFLFDVVSKERKQYTKQYLGEKSNKGVL